MKNIPPLYHWSLAENRAEIEAEGLKPTTPHRDGTLTVCFGSSPLDAWALSGALRTAGDWDLWQAHVGDTKVFRVSHWGRFAEWRIPRVIHPRGLALVAHRTREG